MKKLLVILLLLSSQPLQAGQWNMSWGLSGDQVHVEGADRPLVGASLKLRHLDYRRKASGVTYGLIGRNFWSMDAFYGWGTTMGQSHYWEFAIGFAYGLISGPGVFFLSGPGIDLDSKWSASLPLIIRTGFYWEASLQLGYKL